MIITVYIIICFILAKINADRIAEGKAINHPLQGALHIIVGLVCGVFINISYLLLIPLTARLWFTYPLYLFEKKPFFYVTDTPRAQIDKLEQKIFGKNGKTPFIIYLTIWIAGIIFLLCGPQYSLF